MSNTDSRQPINRMSAKELVIHRNSPITPVEGKNGAKSFFICGRNADGSQRVGFMSDRAIAQWKSQGSNIDLDSFQYAEMPGTDKAGNPAYIPCLMVKGNGGNALQSAGMELLRKE